MLYKLSGEEVTKFNFRATRFYYTTPRGRYLLLDWIARHIDQAGRAEIWLPPYEHPETWLADMQVRIESQDRAPMSRVLDIAKGKALLAEAGYPNGFKTRLIVATGGNRDIPVAIQSFLAKIGITADLECNIA